jgi:hypothetical protein
VHKHVFTGKVTKQPTCTTDGIRTYTCSCGESYTEKIPALGHKYKGELTKKATCTADGSIVYTCERCSNQYAVTVPATGHKYKEEIVPPTYSSEGYTLHTCIHCGCSYKDNYVPKLEANSSEYDIGDEVVDKPIASHEHTYSKVTIIEATCSTEGTVLHRCACGSSYIEKIPAKGHTYTTIIVPPTETENGYTKHTCTVCGYSYTDNIVPATGSNSQSGNEDNLIDINDVTARLSSKSIVYSGKAKMPKLTVTYNGEKLTRGQNADYIVVGRNCTIAIQ